MTKEQIEKAVDEYIGYSPEMDEGIETTMRRNAFKDGANWRINSAWHKPEEVPENGRLLLTDCSSPLFEHQYLICGPTNTEFGKVASDFGITKWAYIDDLTPHRR